MSFVFMGEPMPWPKENNALMPNGTRRTYHRDKATKTRPAGALMAWHRYMQMKATQVSLQEGVYFDRKTPIRITLDVRITRPKSNKDPFPVTKPDGTAVCVWCLENQVTKESTMSGITISEEKIRDLIATKLPEWIEKSLSSDYSNPIKDAIDAELKAKDGIVRKVIGEILASVFNNEEFKAQIGQQVIAKIVEQGLGRR